MSDPKDMIEPEIVLCYLGFEYFNGHREQRGSLKNGCARGRSKVFDYKPNEQINSMVHLIPDYLEFKTKCGQEFKAGRLQKDHMELEEFYEACNLYLLGFYGETTQKDIISP